VNRIFGRKIIIKAAGLVPDKVASAAEKPWLFAVLQGFGGDPSGLIAPGIQANNRADRRRQPS